MSNKARLIKILIVQLVIVLTGIMIIGHVEAVRGGSQWNNPSGAYEAIGRIHGCTATLISEYAVLTAAHCVTNGSSVRFTLPNGRGSVTGVAQHHPLFNELKW